MPTLYQKLVFILLKFLGLSSYSANRLSTELLYLNFYLMLFDLSNVYTARAVDCFVYHARS